MRNFSMVTTVLLIIGGINWGLIGFFNFNLVSTIFGSGSVERIIYGIVGISALFKIYDLAVMEQTTLHVQSSNDLPRKVA